MIRGPLTTIRDLSMTRLRSCSAARCRRAALFVALLLLLQTTALPASPSGDDDAPPPKAEQNETLVESLLDFFFGPAQGQATKPAPQEIGRAACRERGET